MARPKSAHKKSERILAPASEAEVAEWLEACAMLGEDPPAMLRKLTKAFAAHVREHRALTFPIRFESPQRRDE